MVAEAAAGRRSLGAILASVYGVGTAIGLGAPLIALTVAEAGHSTTVVGLISASYSVAILLGSPLVPRLMRRFGTAEALAFGLALGMAGFLLFPLADTLVLWFALRMLMGFGTVLDWAVSETWINALVAAGRRGRAIGLYATIFAGGLATGPAILSLTGTGSMLPFMIGAGVLLAAAVPVLMARRIAPRLSARGDRFAILRMWRQAPLAFAAVGLSGIIETAIFSLLAVYGLRRGIEPASAVFLVTVFAGGGIVLQPLIGWLADRAGWRLPLIAAAVLFLVVVALLPAAMSRPLVAWPAVFLAGGASASFYTLGLIAIGQRFASRDLAEGNALFIMCYTAGSVAGPALAGLGMELWPPDGFAGFLALAAGLFLLAALRFDRAGPAKGR